MKLRPKGWDKFQHYKDRCPPWIKLHRDLLTDREFMCLPIASKALAPLMWLLASESKDGSFDGSMDELQFRLHISKKEYEDGVKSLIDKGFFIVDSTMLADCNQIAIPETERETERETKKERELSVESQSDSQPVVDIPVLGKKVFSVNKKMVDEWKTAYPAVDVVAELLKMRAWSLSNPTKQKTASGVSRFVNAWLSKSQNQAGKIPSGMSALAQQRLDTMHQLTGGITTPKPGNFWDKPKTNVIEVENVEPKRLL